jgi:ketosteroid isomerase-like protein
VAELGERFEQAWVRFQSAFESGDEQRGLGALRDWISAWDRCVEARETEAFSVAYHDDLEVDHRLPLPGLPVPHGLEQFRRVLDELPDVASRFVFEVRHYERRDDRFLGSGVVRARGRYSGALIRLPVAVVWTYRNGKISRLRAFASRRRATVDLHEADASSG